MVASRLLVGAVLGAVAGAVVAGAATALFAAGAVLVAAFGGASLGGAFGAIWMVFAGMGGSDAYRQTFIAPDIADVCIVSLHTDDADEAANGRARLATRSWLTVFEVDADGATRPVPIPRPTTSEELDD
jgi:hypothetical protein